MRQSLVSSVLSVSVELHVNSQPKEGRRVGKNERETGYLVGFGEVAEGGFG